MEELVYTVSELTEKIAEKLEYAPDLKAVWVKGEIAECTRSSMGHWYFNLKDETGLLKVVMFSYQARNVKIPLTSGIEVLVKGSISVYRQRGAYQMLATEIESAGMGAFRLSLIELTTKLEKDGYFQQKRSLPNYPINIGVATSKSGAALKDIQRVVGKRWPVANIKLFPCTVQGDEAPESIIGALKKAYRDKSLDLLILARGGGSTDDLWAFNDEKVAITLFESPIPTVTGVGHEIDRTIVDLVADYAAPTPSGAALVSVPDIQEVYSKIGYLSQSLLKRVECDLLLREKRIGFAVKALEKYEPKKELNRLLERLKTLKRLLNAKALFSLKEKDQRFLLVKKELHDQRPNEKLRHYKRHINDNLNLQKTLCQHRVWQLKEQLSNLETGLELLNPRSVIQKGYALIRKDRGLIRSVKEVKENDHINILLSDGEISAQVLKATLTDYLYDAKEEKK